jgi:hypothetical protein
MNITFLWCTARVRGRGRIRATMGAYFMKCEVFETIVRSVKHMPVHMHLQRACRPKVRVDDGELQVAVQIGERCTRPHKINAPCEGSSRRLGGR